jgi:hypothetical protein
MITSIVSTVFESKIQNRFKHEWSHYIDEIQYFYRYRIESQLSVGIIGNSAEKINS